MPKKIPTLAAIVLLAILMGGFIVGFEQLTRTINVASQSTEPQKIQASNITDTSFTISWLTQKETTGFVRVRSQSNSFVFYDERDDADMPKKHSAHSVIVKNLRPQTSYVSEIFTNGKSSGEKLAVETGPSLGNNPNSLEPAYGSLIDAANSPVADGLVYLSLDGSQMLSTLTRSSGSWLIPLSVIRSQDLSSYIATQERLTEQLQIIASAGQTTAVTDTLNDSPVPAMAIGKSYDFRKIQAKAKLKTAVLGDQTAGASTNGTVSLTNPADGASLTTNLPLIGGTGIPNKTIVVTLGIKNPIVATVTIAADGLWRFTPPKALSPGKYIVTVTSTTAQNKPVAITHTFNIFKGGTQVLGDATPSASLTPTATNTLVPTPTTQLPVAISSPTPTATLTGEPIPTTGNFLPLGILLFISIGLLLCGTYLLTNGFLFI